MPSLSALGQFKFSFNNIANEKADIESLKLPFNDLKLPATEAPPIDFSAQESFPSFDTPDIGAGADSYDFGAFLDSLPGDVSPPLMEDSGSGGLAALDDFLKDLNSGSDETTEDDGSSFLADLLGDSNVQSSEPEPEDSFAANDFYPPDDLLSGLSESQPENQPEIQPETGTADSGDDDFSFDNTVSTPADFQTDDFQTEDFPSEDFQSEDFPAGDFQSEDSGTDDFGGDTTQPDNSDDNDDLDFGAIDLGGESPHDDFSSSGDFTDSDFTETEPDFETETEPGLPSGSDGSYLDLNSGSIDLGGESPDFSPEAESAGDDFSMDGFDSGTDDSDFGSSFSDTDLDSSLPDFDTGFSSDFDMNTEMDFSSSPSTGGEEGPLHGFGDLGSDFDSESIDLGGDTADHSAGTHSEDLGGDVFGNDDFALSGLDDILSKSKAVTITAPLPKKSFFGRKKRKVIEEPDVEENIDEISLSQDDVDKLLKTLSLYPLNLRIVCEELIAEQVILPQQLSKLIRLLVNGAHVKETAAHVESITGKPVVIPKSFEKGTGAAFEAEQSSFAFIFVHNFLPVLKLFAVIAALAGSVLYLSYRFIYTPLRAEAIYKRGYERISAGEYDRANELFKQAFAVHQKKKWFYLYAEAFRDKRRYRLAEEKYDQLLSHYHRDKKGILDYAHLNTYYLMNYEKANTLLQRGLLDFAPDDVDALLAAGDNFLTWADSDPSRFFDKYEDARFCYARVMEIRGWQAPVVERMLKYFIRVDDLKHVLELRVWFESNSRRRLGAESLAELGGYLLDKQLERPAGVPDAYVESIESVRAMLLEAVYEDPNLPEPHYHLARYHNSLRNVYEERLTLENAIRAFNLASQESVRRRQYRVDAHHRYANLLINNREFFPAEEEIIKGIELYEDFMTRGLISATPKLGELYSVRGDLEYFVKAGNMQAAIDNYLIAEGYGYSPPEIQYRIGAAYYQQEDWRNALDYLIKASAELPMNRRLLFALGNITYQRSNYYAAQGYYNRLLDILENQRVRLPVLQPNENPQFIDIGERLMMARNNAGVVSEALAEQTGNREYRSRAMVLYSESARAWDSITRNPIPRTASGEPNPDYMTRMRPTDSPGSPSVNLGYLNGRNALNPDINYRPEIFVRIDKDVLEPSRWEELADFTAR